MMKRCSNLVEMEVRELLDQYEFDGDNAASYPGFCS
jgi:translation elongation factor EF-Tu-like GTPase